MAISIYNTIHPICIFVHKIVRKHNKIEGRDHVIETISASALGASNSDRLAQRIVKLDILTGSEGDQLVN